MSQTNPRHAAASMLMHAVSMAFAGVFAAFEWLRGHVLTGFPWNLVGETWRAGSAMSQTAALVGAYGLTWITLATVSTAVLWQEGRRGRIADPHGRLGGRQRRPLRIPS
jgi:apolipoprotein N-acyltransferase